MGHILDGHDVIAWDMDGTLIDGSHSAVFRDYIAARTDKIHHVVTFRTPRRWVEEVYEELEGYGVSRDRLAGVHGVPLRLYEAYVRKDPVLTGEFVRWKGLKARKIGASVLIDDMSELVVPGCVEHGIRFLHAEDPRFAGLPGPALNEEVGALAGS